MRAEGLATGSAKVDVVSIVVKHRRFAVREDGVGCVLVLGDFFFTLKGVADDPKIAENSRK